MRVGHPRCGRPIIDYAPLVQVIPDQPQSAFMAQE